MDWMTIDSAPKDGSFVIGCVAPKQGEGFSDGWIEQYEQWMAPQTICWRSYHPNSPGKQTWRDASGRPVSPTHWMPLLQPPKI